MAKLSGCYETCLPSSVKLLRVILFILLLISLIVQTLDIAFLQLENGCPTFEVPHFRWTLIVPMLFGLCALIGLLIASHETRTFCLLFFICGIVLVEAHIYREVKRGSVRWISGGCGQDMTQFQLALVYFWFTEALLAAFIVCLDFCLESFARPGLRRPLSLGAGKTLPLGSAQSRQPVYQLMAPLPPPLPPGCLSLATTNGLLPPEASHYNNNNQLMEPIRFISPTQPYPTSCADHYGCWSNVHNNNNNNTSSNRY